MKKVFFLLLFINVNLCFAQIDSLKQVLLNSRGKQKLELLNKLTVLDTTAGFINYHAQAIRLAEGMNDHAGEVAAYCAMGEHFSKMSQPDSLINYYTKALVVAKKHNLSNEIIRCHRELGKALEENFIYDKAEISYNEALAESKKINDKKKILNAFENLGTFHLYQRNDSIALKYFNEQQILAEQLNDSNSLFVCLNNIGLLYYFRGEYENCIQYYLKSLHIEEKLGNKNAVAQSQLNIGITYKNKGNYEDALENLLSAARYFEKKEPSKELGSCYSTLGTIYMKLDQPQKALFYHYKSLDIRKKIKNKKGIAMSYTNIGETYKYLRQYSYALSFINQSIKIKEAIDDKTSLAYSLDILGEIYFLQKDFVQAEKYYMQSMKLKEETEAQKEKTTTLNKLGALYLQWGQYELALSRLEEGRNIAKNVGAKDELLINYKTTIEAFKAKGDLENALRFYDEYVELKDDMLNEQKNKTITELQIKYETEKKDQQILLMDERSKAQAAIVKQKDTKIYALAGGALLLFFIVLLSLNAYRSGKKSNKQDKVIIEQKQMLIVQKQTAMKELHHRVKNNLQVLSSLLQLQQQRLEDVTTKEAIKAVENRMNAMLLIHQDLYGENVESRVKMKPYLEKLVSNLLFSLGDSKGKIKINLVADDISIDADKALNIGFICNEVINNSFKHAFNKTDQPELDIELKKSGAAHLLFAIADNGKGMKIEKDLERSESFGLRLINMLTNDLKGKINISTDDHGTRFEFIIPTNTTIA